MHTIILCMHVFYNLKFTPYILSDLNSRRH